MANVARADLLVMLSVAPALLDDAGERVPFVAAGNRAIDNYIRSDTSAGGQGAGGARGGRGGGDRRHRVGAPPGRAHEALRGRRRGDGVRAGPDAPLFAEPLDRPHAPRAGHAGGGRGARKALVEGGRSLLPSGVREVRGSFRRGDPVDIAGPDGKPFARGFAAYASGEMHLLQGHKTKEIAEVLGYHLGEEAVHRDDLVVLDG